VILPALLALAIAGGLLLRGAWDLWAQVLVHLVFSSGLCLWLLLRVGGGYLPLPPRRTALWCGALALLSAAAVWFSPLRAVVLPEWLPLLDALAVFLLLPLIPRSGRARVDAVLRVAAWILVLLASYQSLVWGDDRPESAMSNVNVYAGTVLLLLPLALERRDWLLAAGLVLNLWWAHSVGAWLGLSAAVVLTSSWRERSRLVLGAAGALLCLVFIYDKFQSPEVLNRWEWWKAAGAMIFERPLSGFGPGAYAHVVQSFREAGGLGTAYAHQYILETAVGYGLPFMALWFAGIAASFRAGSPYKRFGALAVLFHSLWDWPLSVPANLWLFSYFVACSAPESDRGINIPARWKGPALLLVLAAGAAANVWLWDLWAADRAKVRASRELAAAQPAAARAAAEAALRLRPADPEAHLLLAQALAGQGDPEGAAAQLREAAARNPFRLATWKELAALEKSLGRDAAAQAALSEGARWCPRLGREPVGP